MKSELHKVHFGMFCCVYVFADAPRDEQANSLNYYWRFQMPPSGALGGPSQLQATAKEPRGSVDSGFSSESDLNPANNQ